MGIPSVMNQDNRPVTFNASALSHAEGRRRAHFMGFEYFPTSEVLNSAAVCVAPATLLLQYGGGILDATNLTMNKKNEVKAMIHALQGIHKVYFCSF